MTRSHTGRKDTENNLEMSDAKRKHDEQEGEEGSEEEWIGPRPQEAAAEPRIKKIKGNC